MSWMSRTAARSARSALFIKAAVAVLLLLAVAGVVYSQRGVISEFWQAFRGLIDRCGDRQPAGPADQTGVGKDH